MKSWKGKVKFMTERNAINLLLFMCFGISLDNNKSEVDLLKAMTDKAYGDASRHVLSIEDDKICKVKDENPDIYETLETKSGEVNYVINDKKLLKDTLREIASEYIIRYINNLESSVDKSETKKEEEFNDWHKNLCVELCNLYKCCEKYYKIDLKGNKRPFTCGTAQKWVNMTIKYIVLPIHIKILSDL